MFVQTFDAACAIIIDVTPPIHYIVFVTPHKNEIPSPKKASYPAGLFTLADLRGMGTVCATVQVV